MTKEILQKLKKNHKDISSILQNIANQLDEKNRAEKILPLLNKFKREILAHVEYETNFFYAPLKKELKRKNEFTNEMQLIINQMDFIAEDVITFLKKNSSEAKVNSKNFKIDFEKIHSVLLTRINLEENNIFNYWE